MNRLLLPALLLFCIACSTPHASACERLPMTAGTLSLYPANSLPERATWLVEDVQRLFKDNVAPELARRAAPGSHFAAQ